MSSTASSGSSHGPLLPDYVPIPPSALGPALNEPGYYVGRVERNLFWVTDGTYQSAFLVTDEGIVLFDAPRQSATISAERWMKSPRLKASATKSPTSSTPITMPITPGPPTFSAMTSFGSATRTLDDFSCETTIPPGLLPR